MVIAESLPVQNTKARSSKHIVAGYDTMAFMMMVQMQCIYIVRQLYQIT